MSIIKTREFPDYEFESFKELHQALKANKARLLNLKKATVKRTDAVDYRDIDTKTKVSKGIEIPGLKQDYVYPVINTTNYMDSHNDVHLNGIWNKSKKEQQGKILYIVNHDLSIGSEIAYPEDVKMMLSHFSFKELGYQSDKSTQALMFKVKKDKILHERAKDRIEKHIPSQHSVRMMYVNVDLAMKTDDPDLHAERERYEMHVDKIANPERVEETGFFWAVKEAKIIREGSMVVDGSNDVTPMILPKTIEPILNTLETEPSQDTRQDKETPDVSILNNLKFLK